MKENNKWEAIEMIAFREKDFEGDIWSENVFLFKNRDEADLFFTANNKILLDKYTEEDSRVLDNFKVTRLDTSNHITHVAFHTKFAGRKDIYEMSAGYVCSIEEGKERKR